jgi:hypothetical protein
MQRLQEIIQTLKDKGYIIYTQPLRLNVVGVRSGYDTSVNFDDEIAFFWYDEKGNLKGKVCKATTDPSVYYLKDPMVSKGTAILKGGQYVDTYKIDFHRGKYLALTQRLKAVTVIRDNDRNDLLNFYAKEYTGFFGINIHRASRGKSDETIIGPDSAGCQVFQNEEDFNEMMAAATISSAKYGNKFTYTLIDNRDTYKKIRNYSTLGIILIGISFGTYYYFFLRKKS